MSIANRTEAAFFTATILEWKHLLRPSKYKDILVNSLRFLATENRVCIYGFVIMDNHIHIIWQLHESIKQHQVQQSFLKYTAQQSSSTLLPIILMCFNASLLMPATESFNSGSAIR